MGRRRVFHEEPLTAIHISNEAYQFILSQARKKEPRYKTFDRILTKYQELADQIAWFKEAEEIARNERNIAEQDLLKLRRTIECSTKETD